MQEHGSDDRVPQFAFEPTKMCCVSRVWGRGRLDLNRDQVTGADLDNDVDLMAALGSAEVMESWPRSSQRKFGAPP